MPRKPPRPPSLIERLELALETCVQDQLLVLADALEEESLFLRAFGYRWLSYSKREPLLVNGRYVWRRFTDSGVRLGHQLPDALIQHTASLSQTIGLAWYEAQSRVRAFARAADAFERWVLCDNLYLETVDQADKLLRPQLYP